jgi:hypothetical protein
MSVPHEPNSPQPRLRPTRPATLIVAGLATAALSWLGISHFYGDIPTLGWLPAVTLFGLAALEAVAANNTKARIDRRHGTEPVDPLLVARYVVLAKASALVGAIFAGFYAGMVVWLLSERGRLIHAGIDLPPGVACLLAAAALTAAALWLERSCRVPPPPPGGDPATPDWLDETEADPERADG